MRLRSNETANVVRPAGAPGAEAPSQRQLLGKLLSLSPEAHRQIEHRQAETGLLFGEAAVELGFATEEQVRRAIELQQGFTVLPEGDERVDPLVVAAFAPDDPIAVTARDIRAIVTRDVRPDGSPLQGIAMIGIDDETLHTTVLTANLAVACAQAGYSTLLVDGGIGAPRQHGLFRLPNRTGLSTLLSSGGRVEAIAQTTAIPGLSLLSAGPSVPNASELFDRQRLANTLDPLRDHYGLVIFDAGPASATQLEACFGLDAAIIIARRNQSHARALRNAAAVLQEHATPVLGSILID